MDETVKETTFLAMHVFFCIKIEVVWRISSTFLPDLKQHMYHTINIYVYDIHYIHHGICDISADMYSDKCLFYLCNVYPYFHMHLMPQIIFSFGN